jgi:ABC-type nitrate/sulfonate/bicarbonate transport system substrate-binding protein
MLRVGYPQPSGAMLPLWLVSEARLDQKYGAPVQNIFISGAARMHQSMVAGGIDLASIGGAMVNTVLAGGDLVAIAVGVPTYGFSLYARPDVKEVASLQGKVGIMIMRKGASSEHAVIALLQRHNLQPGNVSRHFPARPLRHRGLHQGGQRDLGQSKGSRRQGQRIL